jgi:hypothetical protein
MKVARLMELLERCPEDADIDFADCNFGGHGKELTEYEIEISPDKTLVLITPPYWEALE